MMNGVFLSMQRDFPETEQLASKVDVATPDEVTVETMENQAPTFASYGQKTAGSNECS